MSILTKAIKGKKPFWPKDQWLKDSLVRSAYMDIASTSDNVAFISNNTDDFSNNDKLDFHQDLIDELITQWNGNHFYYTSINRVWEKYISDLEPFIDIKKIEEIIDKSTIKQLLENTMNKQEVNVIDSPLHNVTIDDFNIIWPVEFTEYNRIRVKYKSDSYTKITLDLEAEYEYDVSVYWDWYKASSITTSWTWYVECSIDLELNMTTLNMSFIEDSFVLTSFSVRTYDICSWIEDELNEDKKIKELERYHDTI